VSLALATAELDKGEFVGRDWSDGDVYEWLEGAALAYADQPDPAYPAHACAFRRVAPIQ